MKEYEVRKLESLIRSLRIHECKQLSKSKPSNVQNLQSSYFKGLNLRARAPLLKLNLRTFAHPEFGNKSNFESLELGFRLQVERVFQAFQTRKFDPWSSSRAPEIEGKFQVWNLRSGQRRCREFEDLEFESSKFEARSSSKALK